MPCDSEQLRRLTHWQLQCIAAGPTAVAGASASEDPVVGSNIDSGDDATVTIGELEFGPWAPRESPLARIRSLVDRRPIMPLQHSNAALLPGAHRRNGHGALPTPMGRRADKGQAPTRTWP